MEAFNRIAERDLNVAEAEQATLEALAAWTGENCPVKTIVRRKPAPAPKSAQPAYKSNPTYTKKKPAYTKPKQAQKPPATDIETETLHRLLRPAR